MANTQVQGSTTGGGGTSFGPLAQLMAALGVVSVIWCIFVVWAPFDAVLREATKESVEVDGLFKFMLAAGGVIFIYVQGMLLAFALQYRHRKGQPEETLGRNIHGNTQLEIAWSVAPSLLLIFILVWSLAVWNDEHRGLSNPLRLDVTGFQFGFSFGLPQYGVANQSTVVLPEGRPVDASLRSKDVIHAFWVPQFRAQLDIVPGIVVHEEFTPSRPGLYDVICTQFCGDGPNGTNGHSAMRIKIAVGTLADFQYWIHHPGATVLPSGIHLT